MSTALSTLAEYARANPRSQAAHERALTLFPSGLTHDARRQDPFPPSVTRAEGAYKWDLDGHRILDYVMGHGAPWSRATRIRPSSRPCAGRRGSASTSARAASCRPDWAERIVALVPSAERVRFTSSGTEATLLALRVARGFTGAQPRAQAGRALPRLARRREPRRRAARRSRAARGSPPNPDLTVVDPFAEGALEGELARGDVACVILEPTGAAWGAVPLAPERVASHRGGARARTARSSSSTRS